MKMIPSFGIALCLCCTLHNDWLCF